MQRVVEIVDYPNRKIMLNNVQKLKQKKKKKSFKEIIS